MKRCSDDLLRPTKSIYTVRTAAELAQILSGMSRADTCGQDGFWGPCGRANGHRQHTSDEERLHATIPTDWGTYETWGDGIILGNRWVKGSPAGTATPWSAAERHARDHVLHVWFEGNVPENRGARPRVLHAPPQTGLRDLTWETWKIRHCPQCGCLALVEHDVYQPHPQRPSTEPCRGSGLPFR